MLAIVSCCEILTRKLLLSSFLVAWCLLGECSIAQLPLGGQGAPASSEQASDAADQELANDQLSVANRFKKLEILLLRSAEIEAAEDPTRSALLKQAAQLSKQAQLSNSLAQAAENLKQQQFTEAIERQKLSRESLAQLLELLQRENRGERVREEREQVRRWIEETDRLLRLQGSLRGRTEAGQESGSAAQSQGKLADKAAEIAKSLGDDSESGDSADGDDDSATESQGAESQDADAKTEPGKNSSGDNQRSANSEQGDSGSEDPKSGEQNSGDPNDASKSGGENESAADDNNQSPPSGSESGEQQQASSSGDANNEGDGQQQSGQQQSGQQQSGQQQSGQQQSGQQQQSQPQSPADRAKERIRQAKQAMREAQEQLEDSQREGAIEKQQEAEQKLREAIEELESILRQLREEEVERALASLESRLRRMLEMQTNVYNETKRLYDIVGAGETNRQVEIKANNLAAEETKILNEGERAFLLLKEEGSSAAFPEAVEQLNTDIANVVERLNEAQVGKLTLMIEEEVITSLEEMVEALVQVQQENERKKQQQQRQSGPQQGQPGDEPLVDKLAELRLVKTLQLRINKRTNALSDMLNDPEDPIGQAEGVEILSELKGLAERQYKIMNVTRGLGQQQSQ